MTHNDDHPTAIPTKNTEGYTVLIQQLCKQNKALAKQHATNATAMRNLESNIFSLQVSFIFLIFISHELSKEKQGVLILLYISFFFKKRRQIYKKI